MKTIPAIIILGSMLAGCSGASISDAYDIYKKTSVTGVPTQDLYYQGNFLPVGQEATVEDYCYTNTSDAASATGTHLKEYILENGVLSFGDRDCGCINGACVMPKEISQCEDSDNGKDVYTKGIVVGIQANEAFISEFSDYCDESPVYRFDDEKGESFLTGEIEPGKNLLEGFCTTDMRYNYEWIPCEFGCLHGACLRSN